MISDFIHLITKRKSKQVIVLYTGTVLQLVLGLVTSIIVTRTLGPEQYGNYSYLFNLFNLILVIVSTGHFVSISMILAQSENENNRQDLLGVSLLITLIVSIVFMGIIFIFSFFQDHIFRNKLGESIRILSFFLLLFPLQTYLENVLMGMNRINNLSALRIFPKILYIIALLLYIQYAQLNYFIACVLLLATSYIVYVIQILKLKPNFNDIAANYRYIASENKRYGLNVYLGSLAGVATTYLCTLSISYFFNNKDLGFFNLALVVSGPLGILPSVIATTFFKNFVDMNKIPDKLIKYTMIISLGSYAIFVLLIKEIILILYSADYSNSVSLAYILGMGMIIHGFGDIFNRYLCAKAKGKEVRNGAFVVGAVNVISAVTLVPLLSAHGAAIARLLVGITYCFAMFLYYRNVTAALSCSECKS